MPEDKSDFCMVAKAPVEGAPPVGLRVSKIVRGKDESLYTFLLPGLVPTHSSFRSIRGARSNSSRRPRG